MKNVRQAQKRWAAPRPFLKWVGGKGQLLPQLVARVERAGVFGRYHEPFVGGGALFFELFRMDRLRKQAWLSDSNGPLTETYRAVREDVEGVIALLKEHKRHHCEAYFYEVRAEVPDDLIARAARIIYLNKTCYNGLYRENSKGEFNVPFGRYKNPEICDEENLRAVAKALRKAKVQKRHFETVVDHAAPGDFVYFDPPYYPVSKTSSFTSYDRDGFDENLQRLLAKVCQELHQKGVKFLLSNSRTPFIEQLYKGYKAFRVETVQATRAVNSKADKRGKIDEVLVRNF